MNTSDEYFSPAEHLCSTHANLLERHFVFVDDRLYANIPGPKAHNWMPIKSFTLLRMAIKKYCQLSLSLNEIKELLDICQKKDYVRSISKEEFLEMK